MTPLRRAYRVGNGTLAAFGLASLVGLGGVWLRLVADDAGTIVIVLMVGGIAVVVGVSLTWLLRAATLVRPRGITIRGLFRAKHLLWGDIQELRVERHGGAEYNADAPAEAVYAYDSSAARHLLPHLNAKNVDDFAWEIQQLRRTWEQRRGDDWRQTDRVAADVAERERFGISPWISAIPTALLGFFVGMCVLFLGMCTGWAWKEPPWKYLFGPWIMAVMPVVTYFGVVCWAFNRRRRARAAAPPRS